MSDETKSKQTMVEVDSGALKLVFGMRTFASAASGPMERSGIDR